MFGYDKKEVLQRNDHLVQSHHYDRLLFCTYYNLESDSIITTHIGE